MKVLVINAGSSSLKFQLIDMTDESVLAKGICQEIGNSGAQFKLKVPGRPDVVNDNPIASHGEALKLVLGALCDEKIGVIRSVDEIGAVGHRVLHGGEKLSGSVLVTDEVKKIIDECKELGPLHNPANLKGIVECEKIMSVPQVAVFDTGFHQTMPDYVYLYALPYEYYEKYKIRRYGFHGTSHRYVSERAARMLGKKPQEVNVVTCHLGNGASLAAVKGGKCYDTTMGVTPLEGMMMGTRCGSIDPAIVPYLMKKENLSPDEVDKVMNKKSGMLGITGISSDNQIINRMSDEGNEKCRLAEKMYVHQITKYVGSYIAAMGGADAIVFTGGIGENSPKYRREVAKNLAFLGLEIDEKKNAVRGKEIAITTPESKVQILVIPTDEELVIARDTFDIVNKSVK